MVSLKKTAAAGGFCFFLMLSCGEFDSVLPVTQTYQVSAMAGDHSLDEYAGIRLEDEIQPFFVHPVQGDQDIRGLAVSLQTPDGKPAGQKIRYLFGEPEEEEDGEALILAAETDGKLPRFRMKEDLETGSYDMVFQILGEKGKVFSKTEKPVFYLAGADYGISEITAYLPGYSPGSYLLAPGTVVMLEARVTAGGGLDPYVVWYDGKKRIGEGRISAGGGSLFFKVPEENGFRLLRAEAFPFAPDKKSGAEDAGPEETARGKIRELSLPVSLKGTGPDYVLFSEKEGGNFACHYLFAGDLQDSLDSRPERALVKENADGDICWLGYGGVFGLAAGPGDCYFIPQEIAGFSGQHGGKKTFSFRGKLLRDGPVFSVLPADGSGEIQLSVEKEHLVLTLTTEGSFEKVEMAPPPAGDFIAFSLSLDFRGNAAVLSAEGAGEAGASLNLAGLSAGAAVYRLGAPAQAETGEEKEPGEDTQDPPGLPALILDELAVTAEE
jgi:hypothetical protein